MSGFSLVVIAGIWLPFLVKVRAMPDSNDIRLIGGAFGWLFGTALTVMILIFITNWLVDIDGAGLIAGLVGEVIITYLAVRSVSPRSVQRSPVGPQG